MSDAVITDITAELNAMAPTDTAPAVVPTVQALTTEMIEQLARLFRFRKSVNKTEDLWAEVMNITGGVPVPEVQISELLGKLVDNEGKPWPATALAPIRRVLSLSRAAFERTRDEAAAIVAASTEGKIKRVAKNASAIAADMQKRVLAGATVDEAVRLVNESMADKVRSDAQLGAELLAKVQAMLRDNSRLVSAIVWPDEQAESDAKQVLADFRALACLPGTATADKAA